MAWFKLGSSWGSNETGVTASMYTIPCPWILTNPGACPSLNLIPCENPMMLDAKVSIFLGSSLPNCFSIILSHPFMNIRSWAFGGLSDDLINGDYPRTIVLSNKGFTFYLKLIGLIQLSRFSRISWMTVGISCVSFSLTTFRNLNCDSKCWPSKLDDRTNWMLPL